MAQGPPPPPPHMAGMGPGPSFMHHQPPPPPHPNHGFPPTYHHQPNGYPGPHVPPPHASYGGYPPQPSPNGVFHPGHRPPPMNGFPPPGQQMSNGIGSPHGMQPPGFPGPHPHQQYGPRGRESPFPPHQAHLPPLGGPLYGSPNSHFPHPDAQQQVHQPPSTSAPVQPSPQTAHARASSQSVQPATPHEGQSQSNGATTTSGASASPSLHNLLS
jgi:hypothetical protein